MTRQGKELLIAVNLQILLALNLRSKLMFSLREKQFNSGYL